MIRLPQDFKDFLRLLNSHHVEYLLIGGYAVAYHGYPRATADMAIWVAVHQKNALQLVSVLKEFEFDLPDLSPTLFQQPEQVIRMGVPPIRIEILTSISGVEFDECHRARIEDEIDGVPVKIISLEHLKINKKYSARHKDLADLDYLP